MRVAKAPTSLHICMTSPGLSPLVLTKYASCRRLGTTLDEMMVLVTSACGESSDEPACMHDLARAFASRF